MNIPVRVGELLKRPYFQRAEVIATRKALERPVKWVHIMEITNVGHLLDGHELILSTGIGWKDQEEISLSFLRQLIDHNAAGLCVELGAYAKEPSDKMKHMALEADFPLIFFHEEVRYIDITRDLHTFFINRHHQMIASLDELTNRFNRLLLSGKGYMPLLRLLHEKTGKLVAFLPESGPEIFVPALSKSGQTRKRNAWLRQKETAGRNGKRAAFRPIAAMNRVAAELWIEGEEELSEFDLLALDRCATAVAQEMMRTMHVEERRKHKENGWIQEWLDGGLKEPAVSEYVASLQPDIRDGWLTACVFELDRNMRRSPELETLLIQRILFARSVFASAGFTPIPVPGEKRLIFVLTGLKDRTGWTAPLAKSLEKLRKLDKPGGPAVFGGLAGVGPAVRGFLHLPESFEGACACLDIQKTAGPLPRPFYTELHVYRLLPVLEKTGQLESLVRDYLGPILPGGDGNQQLLKTLKVYLQYSGAKQETANALFIVRQTLYHRLDKIGELLGEDFMAPEKRLMIELALFAYEYLYGPIS
jgi:purine catabolism regulator